MGLQSRIRLINWTPPPLPEGWLSTSAAQKQGRGPISNVEENFVDWSWKKNCCWRWGHPYPSRFPREAQAATWAILALLQPSHESVYSPRKLSSVQGQKRWGQAKNPPTHPSVVFSPSHKYRDPLVGWWKIWSPQLPQETLVQWIWRNTKTLHFSKQPQWLWYRQTQDHTARGSEEMYS